MKAKKNKGLTREQATQLYKDLQKTLGEMNTNTASSGVNPEVVRAKLKAKKSVHMPKISFSLSGQRGAMAAIVMFGCMKIAFSAMEYTGVTSVQHAEASMSMPASQDMVRYVPADPTSAEQRELFKHLDSRRAELQAREEKISDKEENIKAAELELTTRLTELKRITEKLKLTRQQGNKKRDNQLEQLSKVYSSMNPNEAAKLLEQLDVTIALSLIKRMPEKRIGQVLSLMSPERALALTKLLSGNV
ncbi:MAG: hypothetical protein H6619_05985 [Deltaproteobacteria bacterium]|nr:hypothetical protein [Deltaproteobacteria bacterium]